MIRSRQAAEICRLAACAPGLVRTSHHAIRPRIPPRTILWIADMNTISISRRDFARLLGAGAAAAFVRPAGSFSKQPEHIPATGQVVRLSANENPYGPSPKALKAMTDSFTVACRYPDEHNNILIDKLAKLNGAEVVKIPLTSTFAHDVPKMLSAAKGGLIYVCNPNNPTASITPKNELRDFIAKSPPETM